MKRTHLILLALGILGVVGFIYFMATQQVAKPYVMSSTANEPALAAGTSVIASSLWEYDNGSFIVFSHKDFYLQEEVPYIFRLMASEGDTLQIKKGVVYVNGSNADASLSLKHQYQVHFDDITPYENVLKAADYLYSDHSSITDSLHILLADTQAHFGKAKRRYARYTKRNSDIEELYNARWNKDNFGPLVIPKNKLFVMGDNRDNAMDSRYIGLIDKENVLGSVKVNQ